MRVLHIVPSYYPAFKYGGPIESVYLLNKALLKKGIIVDVLTTNAGIEERSDIPPNKWLNIDGVKVKYFPYYFYEYYSFSPELFISAMEQVSNYDLVHITSLWCFPVLAGSIASVFSKKPFIISPRGMLYEEAINVKSKHIKKLYFHLIAKHYLKRAAAIHYTTGDERDRAGNFVKSNNQSFVIPNGLDLNKFVNLPEKGSFKNKYPILKDKKYILFLSRLDKQKGISLLIEAFRELAQKYSNLFLVIAGPDNVGYKRDIESQLKNYGLLDKTLFTGMLIGDDKLSAYVDAELFVLSSYFENFGMTVIEAMACKTPVVISNRVGIYKEVKEHNAGIVVNLSTDDLHQAIKTILDNPQLGEEITGNGRILVQEKFEISKVADMMIDSYSKILKIEPKF